MDKAVSPSRPPKGKRTVLSKYARHACAQCKKAKTKCEGGKPVCERCLKTGHECVWTLEDARRPLTRAHEQALKHQNALLRAEVDRLTQEVENLKLQVSTGTGSVSEASPALRDFSNLSSPGPVFDDVSAASDGRAGRFLALTGVRSAGPPSAHSDSSPAPASASASAPGLGASTNARPNSNSPRVLSPLSPESRTLWAILPVEDITSDVQDEDVPHSYARMSLSGAADRYASDSDADGEARDDPHGPDTEFDCDVESNANDADSGDSEEDSDVDVDKALIAPTKTLFSEQDDLHHYGLTSVFRLRRRASRRDVHTYPRPRPRKSRNVRGSATASGYDSMSSSQGIRAHDSLRSFLSSSSVNEATGEVDLSATITTIRSAHSAHSQLQQYDSTSPVDPASGAAGQGSGTENRLKRDRKGKRRQSSHLHPNIDAYLATQLQAQEGNGAGGTVVTASSSTGSTRRHVLVADALQRNKGEGIEEGRGQELTMWKGSKICDCQSDCWSRWLPKDVPISRMEHDLLLDRTFLFFTSWCMRVIPEYFLRDMYTFLHSPSSSQFRSRSLPNTPLRTITASHTYPYNTHQPLMPRLAHYSPFLHNMLLAVGSAFSSDPIIRLASTRARFAEEGKSYLEEECSRPSVSTVQALGLLASYCSGQGLQTLGFTYFGMSTRIAQALGLFADCTPLLRAGRLRSQQVFDRTWCFHMAAAQDTCWSLYVGRECGIPLPPARTGAKDTQTESQPPSQGKEGAKEAKNPQGFSMDDPFYLGSISADGIGESLDRMAWRARPESEIYINVDGDGKGDEELSRRNLMTCVLQCKTFTTFQWTCQLMKIGRSIMDLMNLLASSDSGTEVKLVVTDIDIQLDAWRQDLPTELKITPANETATLPHKLMMHAAFWWHIILLHRPFYQRHRSKSVDSLFSVTRCNVAAREILTILRLWRKIYGTVRYCPITLIQTIFAAGTIYILQAIQASSGRRRAPQAQAKALENLEELVGYLREVAESWEAATRIADIFQRLAAEQRKGMTLGLSMGAGAGMSAGGGKGLGGLVKKGSKKRRKLDIVREGESTSQSPSTNDFPPTAPLDIRIDGAGEMSSPAIRPPATSGFDSPHAPQQALFSSPHRTYSIPEVEVSPVFSSSVPGTSAPISFDRRNRYGQGDSSRCHDRTSSSCPATTAINLGTSPSMHLLSPHQQQQQLMGANPPTFPTGYLSDESYISDAAPASAPASFSAMNIDDWWNSHLETAAASLSPDAPAGGAFSPASQPTSAFGTEFDFTSPFGYLFNSNRVNMHGGKDGGVNGGTGGTGAISSIASPGTSMASVGPEVNMDAVMPGMSLFNPTGLGSVTSGVAHFAGSSVNNVAGGQYHPGFGASVAPEPGSAQSSQGFDLDFDLGGNGGNGSSGIDLCAFSSDVDFELDFDLDADLDFEGLANTNTNAGGRAVTHQRS